MNAHKQFLLQCMLLTASLLLLAGCATNRGKASRSAFTFAVAGDPRNNPGTWCNALQEIRDMATNPSPTFPPVELFVVPGDFDPVPVRYREYQDMFDGEHHHVAAFLPVMGNHDQLDRPFIQKLLAQDARFQRHDANSANYYYDWKNSRFIALDVFAELGETGMINQAGIDWVESVIAGTPPTIDHIFVGVHPPAFPRHRHFGEALDENPTTRNAFWSMLVRHQARVRAVFVAHSHYFYRMRVQDPTGKAANDPEQYPDEPGGVLQVDTGATGRGNRSTVVFVFVDGKTVNFRVVDAKNGIGKPFGVVDQWTVQAP